MDGYNIIQDSGVNSQLARRLNTISGPASSLAPEVMPVVLAAEYTAEQNFWAGVGLRATRVTTPLDAANFSGFRLRNPAGSRTLIVVERVYIGKPTAQSVQMGVTPADTNLSSVSASGSRDTRTPPTTATQQSTAIASVGIAGTPTFTTSGKVLFLSPGFVAVNAERWDVEVVLAPGTSFEMWSNAVNQNFQTTVLWRERTAQPSELV